MLKREFPSDKETEYSIDKKLNNNSSPNNSFNNTLEISDLSLNTSEMAMFNNSIFNSLKVLESLDTTQNDSMETDETPTENDQMLQKIIQTSDNGGIVSNNDLLKVILNGQEKTDTRLVKIDKKLSDISSKVDLNEENIQIVQKNCAINRGLILRNLASVNYIKQEKIDDEVFVSGFATIADEKTLVKKLCKTFNTPENSIKSHHSIQTKKDGGIKSMLNIKFCTKEDQIKFLTSARAKPIDRAAVLDKPGLDDTGKAIKISRRLTPENRQVISNLLEKQSKNLIKSIRYRNCTYQFQPLTDDKYIAVPSIEHLQLYNFKVDFTKSTKK